MAKKVIAQKSDNRIVAASVSQHFEGPLPAPADFAAYKETLPSAPERISRWQNMSKATGTRLIKELSILDL